MAKLINYQKQLGPGMFLLLFTHFYLLFKPAGIMFVDTYYPVYIIALAFLFLNRDSIKFDQNLLMILVLCIGFTLISFTNSMLIGDFDRRLLFTWLAWFTVLLFTASIKRSKGDLASLVGFAKIVIVIQLIIVSIQVFEPNAFDYVWSSRENRGLDRDLRVSGSLSSPTEFAFIMTYLGILTIARRGPIMEFLWVILILIMILMSGSRTFILGYPLVIGAWFYLEGNEGVFKRLIKAISFTSFLYILSFVILFFLKDTLLYSAELLRVLPLKEISELLKQVDSPVFQTSSAITQQASEYINSTLLLSDAQLKSFEKYAPLRTFSMRNEAWHEELSVFFTKEGWEVLIGSHLYSSSSAHQDYIFMLTRYGVFGLIAYLFLFAFLLSLAYQNRHISAGKTLYLVCLLVIGSGTANTIGVEMRAGIFIALAAGILLLQTTIKPARLSII